MTATETTPPTQASVRSAAALIFVALNLRLPIAALAPVLTPIQRTDLLSSTAIGLLTALPVLCFGLVALGAPRMIRRVGMAPLLGLTMVAVIVGTLVRVDKPVVTLFVGTAVIGAGVAIGNVLLPGLIKRDFAKRAGTMTGLYSVSLFVGAALSAGLTVPLERTLNVGWRPAVALWGVFAVAALVVWAPQMRRQPSAAGPAPVVPIEGLWKDRLAWMVTLFMGLQSLGYYATLNWIPSILEDHGMSSSAAGWMLSYSAFPGMAAALAAPALAQRVRRPAIMIYLTVGFCAGGYLGLMLAPAQGTYAWMTILGIGQGLAISLALGYILGRSPDSHHAAQLSTMAQGVGYLIACTGPFLLGAVHDLTGTWTVPLILLLVVLVPFCLAGLQACQDRHVLS